MSEKIGVLALLREVTPTRWREESGMSQQIDSTQTPWGERRITGQAAVEEAVRTYYPADEALERLKNTPIPAAGPARRGSRALGGLIDLILPRLIEKGL